MIKKINGWQFKNNGARLPKNLEFESLGITIHNFWMNYDDFYIGIEKNRLYTFFKFDKKDRYVLELVPKQYLKYRFVEKDYSQIRNIRSLIKLIPSIPEYLSKNKSLEIVSAFNQKVSITDGECSGTGLTVDDAYNAMWLDKIVKIGFNI